MAAALYLAGCVASSADKTAALSEGTSSAPAAASSYAEPTERATTSTAIAAKPAATAAIPVSGHAASVPASEVSMATAAGTPGSEGYRVGPLDVLDVTVFKVEDLSKTVQVSESGKFGFPLVGEVQAGGRTVSEIEKDLATKLGGNYLRNPQVTVLVKEYNSHRITVEGAVKKAGVYPMQGPMSLLQAIATAGGLDEVSDGSIMLFRRIDGQTAVARFSMNDLRAQRADDPALQAGDIVMVPSSDLRLGIQYILRAAPLLNAFVLL